MDYTTNTSSTVQLGERSHSNFACIFCKRRKVKCDRTLPFCTICCRSRQPCEYPVEAGRPGPKIGSTRGRRKRVRSGSPEAREDRSTEEARSGTPGRVGGEKSQPADNNAISAQKPSMTSHVNNSAWSPAEGVENNLPTPVTTPLDVHTLAYIVHPSHETASITTPEEESLDMSTIDRTSASMPYVVTHACSILGISVDEMQTYINLYFDNMFAFSIFHRPSFESKIRNASSSKELAALLASMFGFSSRFKSLSGEVYDPHNRNVNTQASHHSPNHFQILAQKYVDEELLEYLDKPPPLGLLQALILLTFQQLTTGVRGAAWRRLGLCTRIAYELQLHHIDFNDYAETNNAGAFCAVEERRRAWWAVWEMDVFASTIKRCPSGIDRCDNETRLPAPDEYWYKGRVFRSCFLEPKPMDRVSSLRECGNESEKAWFLVLNSIMYEGHVMSKYRSAKPGNGRHGSSKGSLKNAVKDVSENLLILANALKCFSLALPKALRYRDEFLSFTSRDANEAIAVRRIHSAKYSIHVTTQLTRCMVHHHDAYRGALQDLQLPGSTDETNGNPTAQKSATVSLRLGPTRKGLQQYMDAADEILAVASRSSEDHIRYVNPFLASSIWYGAAIHLSWKVLAPSNLNLDVIHSKYEVLRMSYEEYTEFWDLPKELQENLQSMEEKLKKFKSRGNQETATSSGHNQGKVNRMTAASVYQMNFGTRPSATDIAVQLGDDSTVADLQAQFRLGSHGDANCPSPRLVEEAGRWQMPSKSMDVFNMESIVTTDNSGQIDPHYMGPGNDWSDLGLGLDFVMEQDFDNNFTNYNYAEI